MMFCRMRLDTKTYKSFEAASKRLQVLLKKLLGTEP